MALTDMVIMPGADYQAACDSIRAKAGTTDLIKSGDMSALIDSLGGGGEDIDLLINRNITEINNNTVSQIGRNAFCGCGLLTSADFPAVRYINDYAFNGCSELATINFPAATNIGISAFEFCSALTIVDLPSVTRIYATAFSYCSALTALILRSETICNILSANALENSAIASGEGYIYVPAALVDSYKAAANWSTYADQIRAVEDYTVDGTTTGVLNYSAE